ncbi:unnamed protein product [Protopolystoma xenopodis]|uniref:Uncharacterized protein n=1 Tax=Protopolystoma xenopodis TaxID=117903 RepID=A0A448XNQ7_9PLAT|nr:unnamed protein product [Protopolystoma xenopodis]
MYTERYKRHVQLPNDLSREVESASASPGQESLSCDQFASIRLSELVKSGSDELAYFVIIESEPKTKKYCRHEEEKGDQIKYSGQIEPSVRNPECLGTIDQIGRVGRPAETGLDAVEQLQLAEDEESERKEDAHLEGDHGEDEEATQYDDAGQEADHEEERGEVHNPRQLDQNRPSRRVLVAILDEHLQHLQIAVLVFVVRLIGIPPIPVETDDVAVMPPLQTRLRPPLVLLTGTSLQSAVLRQHEVSPTDGVLQEGREEADLDAPLGQNVDDEERLLSSRQSYPPIRPDQMRRRFLAHFGRVKVSLLHRLAKTPRLRLPQMAGAHKHRRCVRSRRTFEPEPDQSSPLAQPRPTNGRPMSPAVKRTTRHTTYFAFSN